MLETYFCFKEDFIGYSTIFSPSFLDSFLSSFYAHSVENGKRKETMIEHSNQTLSVFNDFVKVLNLDNIFINLINNIYNDLKFDSSLITKSFFLNFLLNLVYKVIYYHDLGKINLKFQQQKLNNNINFDSKEIVKLSNTIFKDTKHSKYSKYFLDCLLVNELEKLELYKRYKDSSNVHQRRVFLKILKRLAYLGMVINSVADRHHSNLIDVKRNFVQKLEEFKNVSTEIDEFSKIIFNFKTKHKIKDFYGEEEEREFWADLKEKFSLYYLYKLVYSCLILSDSYATYSFYNNTDVDNITFKTITAQLLKTISYNFYHKKDYNKQYLSKAKLANIKKMQPKDISSLNTLRSKIFIEASVKLAQLIEGGRNRIFFLNVPTGGGKTNISMKLFLDILENTKTEEINRVFYVFPYVNIIEQNYDVIVETLTSSEMEEEVLISKIYSYTEWDFSMTEEKEGEFLVNQQFLNNPINIISNVNFFNTFIKNSKKTNGKLAMFANSVVIIDEIQTLPNTDWEYFAKLLQQSAENLNIYFILMSATLPDLSKFVSDSSIFENLIEKPEKYQNHQCFTRTRTVFELDEKVSFKYFIERIKREKNKIKDSKIKVLCVTNTIQNSFNLYSQLKETLKDEYDVYILNSTVLSQRRRLIIDLFNIESNKLQRNMILVSTQSIEAGVDIDCHFGFREYCPMDSIEQIAGRINRESTRPIENSKLYVFDLQTATTVYSNDIRMKIQELHNEETEKILQERKFNLYYDWVINFLKNREDEFKAIYNNLIKPTYSLNFERLSKYNYFKDDSFTLFLPIDLDITKYPLAEGEKLFLQKKGIKLSETLAAEEVWNLLEQIKKNQDKNRIFIEIKKLQSILNKFSISLHNRNVGDSKYGKSLRDVMKDYINMNEFVEFAGFIKISQEYLKKLNYKIETGLNPENLSLNFDNQDTFFL
ncbi:MAG: CRISPR-associated helicase Cas3' [Candidatus Heimdallarchaeota archaeon]|nr:CRISPR-associated helicase Cas3' [Candidatus Heimdallarchaeota archaeon]MCK4610534.1 CRISPR-associated helicase Cas3' [Candidatus Heimdallarchaeota archaeon]